MNIDICFGINNNFCQHCGVVIASILYNSSLQDKYHFHIISDYISEENIHFFKYLRYIKPFKLTIHKISLDEYKHLNVNSRLGVSSLFRWKAIELIKSDKVIYLDSDIIVRKDIRDLFQTDVKGFFCAGIEDIIAPYKIKELGMDEKSLYINSGVMVINLKYARKNKSILKFKEFIKNPWDREFDDQEILNYILQSEIKQVDITWNCMVRFVNYYDEEHYEEVCKDPAIVHFITDNKPWIPGKDPAFKSEYFEYLQLTPWYNKFITNYQLKTEEIILKKIEDLANRVSVLENHK